MTVAIIAGIIVLGVVAYVVVVARTRALNSSPTQQELATLILAVLAEGHAERPKSQRLIRDADGRTRLDPPSPRTIAESWQDVRQFLDDRYPELSHGQRQSMLAHAISMIKPMLSEMDYDLVRRLGSNY